MQAVIRSTSGTNSLQSRITSGVQSSAALGSWAAAGIAPAIANKATANPTAQPIDEIFICAPVVHQAYPASVTEQEGNMHLCNRNCHRATRDSPKPDAPPWRMSLQKSPRKQT